jgi:hypothetical protein
MSRRVSTETVKYDGYVVYGGSGGRVFFKTSVHSKKIEYKQASDPSPCEIYGGMLDAEDLDQKN